MRQAIIFTAIVFAITLHFEAKAQDKAWDRSTKVLSIGMGLGNYYHLDNRYGPNLGSRGRYHTPYSGQFNLQMEWAIHNYVGLGFTTGFGGTGPLSYGYNGEINMPIGFVANFHFYQLIDDKNGKNLHADKLDIYGGLSVGSGFAVAFYDNESARVVPLAWGGLHAGVRWYFTPRVALNAEAGFGKSIVNVGFSFKL
ncbi:MAG: hypothetical protein K9J06_02560 [Flavobacteriales bacterium]|nr:hypothetical protein [Flavobacteriales bacterium]